MHDVVVTWTADLRQHVEYLASTIPDPGKGEAPPFATKVTTMLKWGMWGGFFCCVGGFIIIGARMALNHRRGEGGNHLGSMAIVGFACIIIAGAYTIVKQIVGG